jgi:hypothetical protein
MSVYYRHDRLPPLRCSVCHSELVPRSRMPKGVRMEACQNWGCKAFDKPVDPAKRRVEMSWGFSEKDAKDG